MIRRLAETDDPSGFSCGAPQLDDYLRHYALENMRAGRSVTYIWADEDGPLAGYVTVAGGAIRAADAGLVRAPRYPLPILLGRRRQ